MSCSTGEKLNDEELDAILREADLDGNKHIDFQEFLEVRSDPAFLFVVCTCKSSRNAV